MSAAYIFRQFGMKAGYRPSEDTERQIIADYVNEAAQAIYDEAELPELIKELSGDDAVAATADVTLVLPAKVGELRAMREKTGRYAWSLRDSYHKYQPGEVSSGLWFSWYDRGNFPLNFTSPLTENLIDITVDAADATLEVTIVGKTSLASVVSDTVIMSSDFEPTSVEFQTITAITKNKQTPTDVFISNGDDGTIAVIPNNQLESRYRWVDVSKYPSSGTTPLLMEVLYKEAYQYLYDDGDVFANNAYDRMIIDRALSSWCADNARPEEAILRDRRSSREVARKIANGSRGKLQVAKFMPHEHDTLVPRGIGWRRNTRRLIIR